MESPSAAWVAQHHYPRCSYRIVHRWCRRIHRRRDDLVRMDNDGVQRARDDGNRQQRCGPSRTVERWVASTKQRTPGRETTRAVPKECRYGKRRGAPTERGGLLHCSARELMTIHLEEPADLLDLVGSPLDTTKWMKLSQQQVDLFAESTGDHQWIHTDPQRAARGPFKGTVAHSFLTLSLTPMFTSEVLQIRELTMA